MAGRVPDERAAERVAAAATKRPERRLFLGGWPRRFIKEQPLGAFGAVVLVSIFASSLAGHDPNRMTLADRLQGPSGEYPLGTDQLGRDFLSRLIYGARISLFIDYFRAAAAIGERTFRTLLRHVLPNVMAPIIVIFSITIGGIIVAEASLSFLGFGLPPGVPSWGGMLSREGRQYLEMAPRLAIWPGLCVTIVVYSINMFGDALRDLLDPRLRGSIGRV